MNRVSLPPAGDYILRHPHGKRGVGRRQAGALQTLPLGPRRARDKDPAA